MGYVCVFFCKRACNAYYSVRKPCLLRTLLWRRVWMPPTTPCGSATAPSRCAKPAATCQRHSAPCSLASGRQLTVLAQYSHVMALPALRGCAGRWSVGRWSAVPLQRGGGRAALAAGGILRGGAAGLARAPGPLCMHQQPLRLARLGAPCRAHTVHGIMLEFFPATPLLFALVPHRALAAFCAAARNISVYEQRDSGLEMLADRLTDACMGRRAPEQPGVGRRLTAAPGAPLLVGGAASCAEKWVLPDLRATLTVTSRCRGTPALLQQSAFSSSPAVSFWAHVSSAVMLNYMLRGCDRKA